MLKYGQVTTNKFMGLDLLDLSTHKVLSREFWNGSIGALATTAAFSIASLFVTFTASLFDTVQVPVTGSLILKANQSFAPQELNVEGPMAAASSILSGNASYPPFTYENLALLEVTPSQISVPKDADINGPTVSVEAVLPAVRAKLDCRLYDTSQITTNLTIKDALGVWIEGEGCLTDPDADDLNSRHDAVLAVSQNTTFFGAASSGTSRMRSQNYIQNACSDMLYICKFISIKFPSPRLVIPPN